MPSRRTIVRTKALLKRLGGMQRSTLSRLIARGLPYVRRLSGGPRGALEFDVDEVERWLRKQGLDEGRVPREAKPASGEPETKALVEALIAAIDAADSLEALAELVKRIAKDVAREVITPRVGQVLEALSKERRRLLAAAANAPKPAPQAYEVLTADEWDAVLRMRKAQARETVEAPGDLERVMAELGAAGDPIVEGPGRPPAGA